MGQANGMVRMIQDGLNDMTVLYKYIFYKAYHFCINVFKEKDFPWMFATGVVSITFVANIISFLELIEYLMLPSRINIYGEYHGYFSLGLLIFSAILMKYNNFYQKVLKEVEEYSVEKRRRMAFISVAYVLVVFISLIYLAYLIRENT